MIPCLACGSHVRASDRACPHCGSGTTGAVVRTANAVLLGLTLVGCSGDKDGGSTFEPEYGVTITDTMTDADTDADTDSDTDADTDTDSDADADTGPTGTVGGTGATGTTGSGAATTGVDYGLPPTP